MRSIKNLTFAAAMTALLFIFGGALTVRAQEAVMNKIEDTSKSVAKTTVKGSKKVYSKGKRVGHTIGDRTWTGTKWVATNTWHGAKWVAVKTANGTKWVYRKGKRAVTGTPKRM